MKKVWPFRFPIYQPGGLIAGYVVAGPHLESTCLLGEPSASTRYTSIETEVVCITCRTSVAFWAPWFLTRCLKHHGSVHCEEKGDADCPVVDGRRMWRHCAACSSRQTARVPGCSRTAKRMPHAGTWWCHDNGGHISVEHELLRRLHSHQLLISFGAK